MNDELTLARNDAAGSGHFFHSLLDLLPELVCYIDKDHRFRFANKSYLRFFNMHPSAMIGLHPWEVLGDEAYSSVMHRHKAALSGKVQDYQSSLSRPDGELMYFHAHYQPHFIDGKVDGFLAVVQDITERKKNELTIQQKAEDLKKVNTALEVLLEHRNRKIEDLRETFYRNFSLLVLPDLEHLKKRSENDTNRKTISMIIQNMQSLLSPATSALTSSQYGLTRTETKIANMIRNGMTSHEISSHLNVSPSTVDFHRKNIRKKFGITGAEKKLYEYLNNHR